MHPGVAVRETMRRSFVGVSESDSLSDTVAVMAEEGARSAVVLRGSEPVGVVDPGAVYAALADGNDLDDVTAGAAMSEFPVSLAGDDGLTDAVGALLDTGAGVLPVVEDGDAVGVVGARDLVTASVVDQSVREGDDAAAFEPPDYPEQGVCEGCGTLSGDLAAVDGRLLCADCHTV